MDEAARKAEHRASVRKCRLDPVYRAAEYLKNAEYRKKNREKLRPVKLAWKRRQRAADPTFKAREAAQTRENYRRLRIRLFAGYGGACSCCGEREHDFLELDHVNGGGKRHYASKAPVSIYREIIAAGFPPEYRVLCANCNRGRQRNGGICPHQDVEARAM